MKIIVDGEGTEILQAPGRIKTYPHSRGPGKVHALRRHLKGSKGIYALCIDVAPKYRSKEWAWALKFHAEVVDSSTEVTCWNCLSRTKQIEELVL